MEKVRQKEVVICYHCGDECNGAGLQFDHKSFCCNGCQAVYDILKENKLCTYYNITQNPGLSQQTNKGTTYFDFLDQENVQTQLIHFREGPIAYIKFNIPAMHCSSCIWLLENLPRLHNGVASARVAFLEKEANVIFNTDEISLKELVLLMKSIGYEPKLSLDDLTKKHTTRTYKTQLYKIGISGFCFGNIMMLSFPDYFASGKFLSDGLLNKVFNYASLILALPVFFYCAQEFFISSWQHLKHRRINIDVPIALAIVITFSVSIYRVIFENHLGYFDSMTGIAFFMLLGRFFQNRSYHYLSFQKSYASYLPISVNVVKEGKEVNIPLTEAFVGDEILIRQGEVVPADGLLLDEAAWFDYSFVTGESNWVEKKRHQMVYAGAIQKTGSACIKISKEPSQSYITQLWNSRQAQKFEDNTLQHTEKINLYFSAIVLALGTMAFLYWMFQGQVEIGLKALITVWIVACPCALLLSSTFTYGHMLSILAGNGLFIKNASVLEKMKSIDTLVFDKTGTLTNSSSADIDFIGRDLTVEEWPLVYSLAHLSIHPLSKLIAAFIKWPKLFIVENYNQIEGKGIEGIVEGHVIKIGSQKWLGVSSKLPSTHTKVFIKIDEEVVGYFEIKNQYRPGIFETLKKLQKRFELHLLSGDTDAERQHLSGAFTNGQHMQFSQLPEDKTAYIEHLQHQKKCVMMIGDGLNDANAFEQSDAGMAVIESEHNYLPACDVILKAEKLPQLTNLLNYISASTTILHACFAISILYNVVGLSFAMQGKLTPVIAAILMPLSTMSIVLLSFLLSRYFAKKQQLEI